MVILFYFAFDAEINQTDLSYIIQGPAIGEWSEWGTWKSCEMPSDSTGVYGTGTKIRERSCDSPPPVCGGDFCVGNSNETGNCRGILVSVSKTKAKMILVTRFKCA